LKIGPLKKVLLPKMPTGWKLAFQAKEYLDLGNPSIKDWINNIERSMRTKSARLVIEKMVAAIESDCLIPI